MVARRPGVTRQSVIKIFISFDSAIVMQDLAIMSVSAGWSLIADAAYRIAIFRIVVTIPVDSRNIVIEKPVPGVLIAVS